MIVLNSVSKSVGRRQFKRVLLEDVNWAIKPRTQVVILGGRHSGAKALLNIIGGIDLPTTGWVERNAKVSIPGGVFRYMLSDTTHQLIARLSRLYHVRAKEINEFVMEAVGRRDILSVTPHSLPAVIRQQLSIALIYAFPYDYYLFESTAIVAGNDMRFRAFCEKAFELRSKEAGIIMTASSGKAARRVSGDMMGAILYHGNLTLYERLSDAIVVFESLPPEEDPTAANAHQDTGLNMGELEESLGLSV